MLNNSILSVSVKCSSNWIYIGFVIPPIKVTYILITEKWEYRGKWKEEKTIIGPTAQRSLLDETVCRKKFN